MSEVSMVGGLAEALEAWREAERAAQEFTPGSHERTEADAEVEIRHAEYLRLEVEIEAELRRDEEDLGAQGALARP
jgi:hypothetical protein